MASSDRSGPDDGTPARRGQDAWKHEAREISDRNDQARKVAQEQRAAADRRAASDRAARENGIVHR